MGARSDDITLTLESIPAMCGLVRIQDSPCFVACNSTFEEALGFESGALAESEVLKHVHSGDAQTVVESITQAANGSETTFECRARHATNGWATFEARARSHPEGVLILARDITEQSRRQEHLGVLNRVLRHNVRNEFNIIDGHLQLIAEQATETQLEHSTDIVRTAIGRWLQLTEHATRIEQLFNETAERQLPVGQLVRGVTTASELSNPRATFAVSIDDSVSGTVSSLLEEAVHELCENAVKHTTESPVVTVTVRPGRHPNTVEIIVADDGDGLPPHEVSVLQTGEETPLVHGTGIGLQLVRMIVEHVGGTVAADTEVSGGRVKISVPTVPAVDS